MRFETNKDLQNELDAITLYCEVFNSSFEKLGENDIDYRVTKLNRIQHIEVKGRNRKIENAFPLPIAARKVVKLVDKKTEPIVIWNCFDGLIICDLSQVKASGMIGGRKPRMGASNDQEYMLYFEKQDNFYCIKKDSKKIFKLF